MDIENISLYLVKARITQNKSKSYTYAGLFLKFGLWCGGSRPRSRPVKNKKEKCLINTITYMEQKFITIELLLLRCIMKSYSYFKHTMLTKFWVCIYFCSFTACIAILFKLCGGMWNDRRDSPKKSEKWPGNGRSTQAEAFGLPIILQM